MSHGHRPYLSAVISNGVFPSNPPLLEHALEIREDSVLTREGFAFPSGAFGPPMEGLRPDIYIAPRILPRGLDLALTFTLSVYMELGRWVDVM